MTVRVHALLTALPDRADELAETWPQLSAQVRAEDGCLSYDLWRSTSDPTSFTVWEEWASMEALKAHGTSAHMVDFGHRGLLAGRSVITLLAPVDVA